MGFCCRLYATAVALVLALSTLVHTQAPATKRVLFLTHAGLYKHPSLGPAEAAVTTWGKTGGFEVTTREGYKEDAKALDMSFFTPDYLASFDGLMLMTNGNLPFTAAQKQSIVEFVRNGKALVGTHCATLTMYDYPEFGEVLGGYYLRSLVPTAAVASGKVGVLKVEDQRHLGHPDVRFDLAAERGVLRVRPHGCGMPTCRPRTSLRWGGCRSCCRSRVTACTCCSASTPIAPICRICRTSPRATTRRPGRARSGAVAPSTRRSAIATTSGPTTRCSVRTSPAASAGRSASRTDAMRHWPSVTVTALAATACSRRRRRRAGPAPLPAPEFHHLHLNSVNPEAAIDFYTRQFPTTSKDTFAGQPALKSPNDVMILFTRVDTPPPTEPPTAFWHFGWHVTDARQALERFRAAGSDAAAALHARRPARRCSSAATPGRAPAACSA